MQDYVSHAAYLYVLLRRCVSAQYYAEHGEKWGDDMPVGVRELIRTVNSVVAVCQGRGYDVAADFSPDVENEIQRRVYKVGSEAGGGAFNRDLYAGHAKYLVR